MHRNKSPLPVVICLVIVAAIVGIGGFFINRYSPTGKFCNVLYLWPKPEEGAGDSHDCAAIAADYQPSHFSGFSAAFC